MRTSPCYNCPDRSERCHSTCEKYIDFSRQRREILDAAIESSDTNWAIEYHRTKEIRKRQR